MTNMLVSNLSSFTVILGKSPKENNAIYLQSPDKNVNAAYNWGAFLFKIILNTVVIIRT